MAFSEAIASYDDVRTLLDQAIASEKGIRIHLETPAACIHLRHRAYAFRKMDRRNNREIFPPGHIQHGKSPYDSLMLTIEGTDLLVQKVKTTFEVTDL